MRYIIIQHVFVANAHCQQHSKQYLFLFLVLVMLWGSACTQKPSSYQLPVDTTSRFSDSGERSLPDEWWIAFQDPQLNTLIDSAFSSNLNIQTAYHKLEAANHSAERDASQLLPDIESSIQSGVSRPEPDYVGGENTRLSLTAGYEVDLWGRIRSRIEAQEYRAKASLMDYQTAHISVAAAVSRTWFQLTAAKEQERIVRQQIKINKKTLQLIKSRFGSGQVRQADILRQRQLLANTREELIIIETQVETLTNQLAVLTGTPPQQATTYQPDSLPGLPPLPETGLPVELIRRRPDVQSAFYQLKAADKELAAAVSARYPRLSISTNTAIRSNDLNNLWQNWARSASANLLGPLFYGGRLNAEADRARSFRQQLLHTYGQTALRACQETEDALIREQKQQERIAALEEQLSLAAQTYQQLRVQYLNGTSDYLPVLTALSEQQQLKRNLITAHSMLIEYRIALYRALAGGIETTKNDQN